MKKNVIVTLVVLALLAAANFAYAQKLPSLKLPVDNKPIVNVLDAVALATGVKFVADSPVPPELMFTGELDLQDLPATFKRLLGPIGYVAEPRPDWSVHIIKMKDQSAAAATATEPKVGDKVGNDVAGGGEKMNTGSETNSNLVFRQRIDQPELPRIIDCRSPSLGDLLALRAARIPREVACGGGNSNIRGNNYSDGQLGAINYGFAWMKGCINGPAGYVKFKYVGKDNERHLWNVYLNGEIVGSLDQGDSFWNKVDVCAGHNQVVVEKVGGPAPLRNERPYSVRPWTLTEITVGDFLFPSVKK